MVWVKWGLLGLAGVLLAIQLVPYGGNHTNPPVVAEPVWDSEETRDLTVKACFDCHRNESVWPWYSNIAPISWSIQHHVDDGRAVLNFSEWNRPQEGDESAETVREGSMPPQQYLLTHRLTDDELNALAVGLAATLGDEEGEGGEGDENHESEEADEREDE